MTLAVDLEGPRPHNYYHSVSCFQRPISSLTTPGHSDSQWHGYAVNADNCDMIIETTVYLGMSLK